MKKKVRLLAALFSALFLAVLAFPARADLAIPVTIPVKVITESDKVPDAKVRFVLEAQDGAPQPPTAVQDVAVGQSAELGPVDISAPGTYVYRLQASTTNANISKIDSTSDFRVEIEAYYGKTGLEAVIKASDWNNPDNKLPKSAIDIKLNSTGNSSGTKYPPTGDSGQTTTPNQNSNNSNQQTSTNNSKQQASTYKNDSANTAAQSQEPLWWMALLVAGLGLTAALTRLSRRREGS